MLRIIRIWAVFSILALGLANPGESSAIGIGGYFEFGSADGELDSSNSAFGDLDYDADRYGFGVAFDTNLAQNRLFNYRVTLGYQRTDRNFNDFPFNALPPTLVSFAEDYADANGNGVVLNNAFGFRIWSGRHHRLWVGPSLRVGVDVYDTNINDLDVVDVTAGGGAMVGLNVHAGPHLTLGLSGGYQYLYVGEVFSLDGRGYDQTETVDGHEHLATVHITIFFRGTGDRFR